MERFQFNYSEFKNNVADTFKDLLSDEDFANVTLVTSDGQRLCRLGETNEIYLSANNNLRLASRDTFIYELCSV